jgi:hypothetical protein
MSTNQDAINATQPQKPGQQFKARKGGKGKKCTSMKLKAEKKTLQPTPLKRQANQGLEGFIE